jgi:hypothetical protein
MLKTIKKLEFHAKLEAFGLLFLKLIFLLLAINLLLGCENNINSPNKPAEKPACLEYPSDLWDKIDSLQGLVDSLQGKPKFNDKD